jgi:tRNA-splicing ligase RtcB
LEKQKQRDARVQFGTLGRGNHFLEFQADQNDNLWLMVHGGSRGIGQLITSHHIAHALFSSKGLKAFEAESESGKAYRNDVVWASRYAAANRLKMIEAAGKLIHRLFNVEIDWSSLIHTNHNHVRHEKHFGKHFWVHRKGAQSAFGEEPGIIPGSMGTASFHVTGRGCEEALCSCSHGAGRRLSRTQALHVVKINQLQYQMKAVFYDQRRSNKLRDEAPTAYKNIFHVMNAQKKLIRVSRELHPLLSYKGI